jgi:hypothetical protein
MLRAFETSNSIPIQLIEAHRVFVPGYRFDQVLKRGRTIRRYERFFIAENAANVHDPRRCEREDQAPLRV